MIFYIIAEAVEAPPARNSILKMIRSVLLLLLLLFVQQGRGVVERRFFPLMIVQDGGVLTGLGMVRSEVFRSPAPCKNGRLTYNDTVSPNSYSYSFPVQGKMGRTELAKFCPGRLFPCMTGLSAVCPDIMS